MTFSRIRSTRDERCYGLYHKSLEEWLMRDPDMPFYASPRLGSPSICHPHGRIDGASAVRVLLAR